MEWVRKTHTSLISNIIEFTSGYDYNQIGDNESFYGESSIFPILFSKDT